MFKPQRLRRSEDERSISFDSVVKYVTVINKKKKKEKKRKEKDRVTKNNEFGEAQREIVRDRDDDWMNRDARYKRWEFFVIISVA